MSIHYNRKRIRLVHQYWEDPTSLADKKFAELVSERSNGRIQIEFVTNGQLGEEADVLENVSHFMMNLEVNRRPIIDQIKELD